MGLLRGDLGFQNEVETLTTLKLFNTQCTNSAPTNHKSQSEAEEIVTQLKQLVMNRPLDSMASMPTQVDIEGSSFLNKKEMLRMIGVSGDHNGSLGWWCLQRNKVEISVLAVAAALVGYMFYTRKLRIH
jgi:hypothetical protein